MTNTRTTNYSSHAQLILEYKFVEGELITFDRNILQNKLHQVRNKKTYGNHGSEFNDISSKRSKDIGSLLSNQQQYVQESVADKNSSSINHPMYRIRPIYPKRAKLLRIEGKVTAAYDINNDGKIENIRILHSTPPKIFDDNIRIAMMSWVYERRKPKNNLIVTFKFNLDDPKGFKN